MDIVNVRHRMFLGGSVSEQGFAALHTPNSKARFKHVVTEVIACVGGLYLLGQSVWYLSCPSGYTGT